MNFHYPCRIALSLCLAAFAIVAGARTNDFEKAAQTEGSGSPTVAWYRMLPTVVRSDRVTPVTLTIKITGGVPDKVSLLLADNVTEILLHDDGLNGDAVAGDFIYSAQVAAATVTGGLAGSDVFRKFLGFGDVYNNAVRVVRVNVFAQIWTPTIGNVPVTAVDAQTQVTNYVMNVVDATTFNTVGSGDFTAAAHRLYQRFSDTFDFIDLVFDSANIANRYHFAIKNNVSGIGLTSFDNSASYGSAGRLRGMSVFPNYSFFDGADVGHSHELGHQWINFLPLAVLAQGTPHWPVSTLASGTMGLSIPGTNVGGDYNCVLTPTVSGLQASSVNAPRVFNDLDLYLMGLIPSAQISTQYVFNDQANALSQPCSGTYPYSMFTAVTGSDVTTSVGARSPAYPNAKQDFTLATLVVSDSLLSADAMAFYDWFARRAESHTALTTHIGFVSAVNNPFYLQTGGRATLMTRLPGTTTIGLYRPSTNRYFLRNSNTYGNPDLSFPFGAPNDIPVVGDWDGDGIVSIGIYRPSNNAFFLSNDNTTVSAILPFGAPGDLPVVGDWNASGTTTVGIYRPSTNTFYLSNNNTSVSAVIQFGAPGDLPIVGDWDGDGNTTIGLYRPSTHTFFLRNSNTYGPPDAILPFGAGTDIPVAGDWDGNGTTTVGIYRPGSNAFFLSNNNTSVFAIVPFGAPNDLPIVGDWNGM